MRQAAATARRHLIEAASRRLNRGTGELAVAAGIVLAIVPPWSGAVAVLPSSIATRARGTSSSSATIWARLNRGTGELAVAAGIVRVAGEPDRAVAYGDLVRGELGALAPHEVAVGHGAIRLPRDPDYAGRDGEFPGAFTYVHDVRVPGMVHGRVVRPPVPGVETALGTLPMPGTRTSWT
jgi:hypothetical protein